MMNSPVWPTFKRPLVAIIRGIENHEVEDILTVLVEEGFEAIEIPLNSPNPWVSITKAVELFGSKVLIGAGTVLSVDDVEKLVAVGGKLMVSPNTNAEVIKAAAAHGIYSMPGCYTATEALIAVHSGASALKFFPAGTLGPSGIAGIKTILPKDAVIGAVGGVSEHNFADYAKVGIKTFGIATSLYQPGDDAATVREKARRIIAAYDVVYGVEA